MTHTQVTNRLSTTDRVHIYIYCGLSLTEIASKLNLSYNKVRYAVLNHHTLRDVYRNCKIARRPR
jgi:DNA-binding NarL/FixJ family response regulator